MKITLNLTPDTLSVYVPKGAVPNMCQHLPNTFWGDDWAKQIVIQQMNKTAPTTAVSNDTKQFIGKAIEPMVYNALLDSILSTTKQCAENIIDAQTDKSPTLSVDLEAVMRHPRLSKLIEMFHAM